MIAECILVGIRRSIEAELADQSETLQHEIREFIQDSYNRGVGIQGFTIVQLAAICSESLDSQATAAWRRMELLLREPFPPYTVCLLEQLKREFRGLLREPYPYFLAHLRHHESRVSKPTRIAALEDARRCLEDKHERTLLRIDADIERFVREVAVEHGRRKDSLYDKVANWLKNRPVLVVILFVFLVISSAKSGAEAVVYLYHLCMKLWPYAADLWRNVESAMVKLAGEWLN